MKYERTYKGYLRTVLRYPLCIANLIEDTVHSAQLILRGENLPHFALDGLRDVIHVLGLDDRLDDRRGGVAMGVGVEVTMEVGVGFISMLGDPSSNLIKSWNAPPEGM